MPTDFESVKPMKTRRCRVSNRSSKPQRGDRTQVGFRFSVRLGIDHDRLSESEHGFANLDIFQTFKTPAKLTNSFRISKLATRAEAGAMERKLLPTNVQDQAGG